MTVRDIQLAREKAVLTPAEQLAFAAWTRGNGSELLGARDGKSRNAVSKALRRALLKIELTALQLLP